MRSITLTFLCFCPGNCYFQASNSFSLTNEPHTMETSIHIRLIFLRCWPAASTPWSASGCSDELAEVMPSLCFLSVEKRGFVFIRCVLSQKKKKTRSCGAFDAVTGISKASAADTKTLTISAPRCALMSQQTQSRSHSFADIHREMMYASYSALVILNKTYTKQPVTR